MKKIYLLGANNNNEFVFGQIKLTHPSHYDREKGCWEDKKVVNLCISFYTIGLSLANGYNNNKKELYCGIDIANSIINSNEYYIKSCLCGQHDTRIEGMKEYVNVEAYDLLHELWDNYHLKQVDKNALERIQKVAKMLIDTNEEEWMADYIERHKEEL